MGLLFPYIPTIQTSHVWRHNNVINADFAQVADWQWNIDQNWIFRQKSSKYLNFTGVLFTKDGNDVSNIYCEIQDHTKKMFFEIVIFNIAGLHPSPRFLILTAYPTPG